MGDFILINVGDRIIHDGRTPATDLHVELTTWDAVNEIGFDVHGWTPGGETGWSGLNFDVNEARQVRDALNAFLARVEQEVAA